MEKSRSAGHPVEYDLRNRKSSAILDSAAAGCGKPSSGSATGASYRPTMRRNGMQALEAAEQGLPLDMAFLVAPLITVEVKNYRTIPREMLE